MDSGRNLELQGFALKLVPFMASLLSKKCVPCEGGVTPLSIQEATRLLSEVPGWKLSPDGKTISREFSFKTFLDGIQFVNEVARLAEEEGHHPDMHVHHRKVKVELTTHAIGGLSINDFIMAAKIDAVRL